MSWFYVAGQPSMVLILQKEVIFQSEFRPVWLPPAKQNGLNIFGLERKRTRWQCTESQREIRGIGSKVSFSWR